MNRIGLFAVAMLFYASPAATAGFDCNLAFSENEILICKDKWLSHLDEHYSHLYSIARTSSKHDDKLARTLKTTTVSALKKRDNDCSERRCLIKWYDAGIQRLITTIRSANPDQLRPKLSAQALYERLNLRTIRSSHSQRLKVDCNTYLKDYYPPTVTRYEDNRLIIEDDSVYFEVSVLDNDTIEISERLKQGSYFITSKQQVYFDPVAKDIRVAKIAQEYFDVTAQKSVRVQDKFYKKTLHIAMSDSCTETEYGVDPKYLTDKDKSSSPQSENLEILSVGEFGFPGNVPGSTTRLFDKPNGRQVGKMNIKTRINEYGDTAITLWIFDSNFTTLMQPPLVQRYKYEARLLAFEKQGSWYNISPISNKPLWLNGDHLPEGIKSNYMRREDVFLKSSEIKIKSAHRLRSEPNIQSEIIKVMQTNDEAQITALSIKGDWMKVLHVTPPNYHDSVKDLIHNPNYTVLEGWLKWRASPHKEYVGMEHWH